MKFTVSIPTCKEGLSMPLPFADVEDVVRLGVAAERLGYHSVWGNDHITAPRYVRAAYADPPRFYEPLVTLAYLAAHTKSIRLATGVLVLPMREPVLLAKQIATLDHVSGGRLILGVGVGAYREELLALHPDLEGADRGAVFVESLEALETLLSRRTSSHRGRFFAFSEIELHPKPVQSPLPIYIGGNHRHQVARAVRYGQGWLPASIPPALLRERVTELKREAETSGRPPASIEIAPQVMVCIARTHEQAIRNFKASPMYRHLNTLNQSTLRDVDVASEVVGANLVGSPQAIIDKVAEFQEIGATMMATMTFVSPTVDATLEDIQFFAEEVFPAFGHPPVPA